MEKTITVTVLDAVNAMLEESAKERGIPVELLARLILSEWAMRNKIPTER